MKLKYYAWMRDRMGCHSDDIVLPREIDNVGRLLNWLPTQGERFRQGLEYVDVVLVQVNGQHAHRDHPVHDDDEVALVPPIAGG
ncbi:MAG: MoaD/ThiS family protein [Burkholderiales bacterium]|nr:MoaD/ThiS family protein [Burkholderiales bacterium]MBK8667256.1 MoaD/ThiS family protein [Burkholderiales bacterium]